MRDNEGVHETSGADGTRNKRAKDEDPRWVML